MRCQSAGMQIISAEESVWDGSLRQFVSRSDDSIKPEAHGFGFKRILLPLDLRDELGAVGPVAASMARKSGAQLVLLHAVHVNVAGEERGIQRTRLVKELCAEAQAKLLRVANAIAPGQETEIVIGLGAAGELILDAARRLNIDAIVMQARPKSRWTQWLHRNTTRKVARRAECTVWLVSTDAETLATTVTVIHRARTGERASWRAGGAFDRENDSWPLSVRLSN